MRSFYATFNSEDELLCSAKKIGWSQIVIILEADLTLDEKKWYIHAAKLLGWSRNELGEKISNSAINEIIIDFSNNYCYNNAEITEPESRYFGDCSEDNYKEIAHKERAVSIQNANSNLSELFLREIIYDKQVGTSMKIILSRKGFDSSNGGCPSPILPDGTLLSIPIPSNDSVSFKDYYWHPYSSSERINSLNNALYVPAERLSFLPDYKGFGVLNYREDSVLTMKNKSRGVWSELEFPYPEHVYGNKKNSAKGEGLYYSGIWQELVVFETAELIEWAKSIIKQIQD